MKLYKETVSDVLWKILNQLMQIEELKAFRLVGGTALSLQRGHRTSIDIDLFTDADYGSVDFKKIEDVLTKTFKYIDKPTVESVGMGKPYFIGFSKDKSVKLDLFYTDPFVFPCIVAQKIRFSSVEEIAAMKLEVIAQGSRKKDFWDIHELLETFSLKKMMTFYQKRNPYGYSKDELLDQMIDFSVAEDDFTPNCLRGKIWELIKLDLQEIVQN